MSFEVRAGESFRESTRRIVREQLSGALDALGNKEASSLDERVHSVRKSFKRIRALLRLVRCAVSDPFFQAENESFRDAGRPLAEVRDAKVLIEALEALRAKSDTGREAAFAAAKELLVERQDALRGRVLNEGGAWAATECAVKKALAQLDKDKWNKVSNSPKKISLGLKAVYRSGRKAFARATDDPSVENLHEWRKQVKHLRHGLELLAPARPKTFVELARQADELGELLGLDHDLAVLNATLLSDESDVVTGALEPLIKEQREQLQAEARDRGGFLYRQNAKKFVRGLKSRLNRWRRESAALVD